MGALAAALPRAPFRIVRILRSIPPDSSSCEGAGPIIATRGADHLYAVPEGPPREFPEPGGSSPSVRLARPRRGGARAIRPVHRPGAARGATTRRKGGRRNIEARPGD